MEVSRNCIELNEFLNDETGVIEEYEDINSIENEFELFVGQCFLSEEKAFIFYKNYTNRNGFTIQKGRLEKKNGKIGRCNFFCHREDRQPLKMVDPFKEQRNRKPLKCGCKARLTIVLQKSIDIFSERMACHYFLL